MNQEQHRQIGLAISSCKARIDNGLDIPVAFQWLHNEVTSIRNGAILYGQ